MTGISSISGAPSLSAAQFSTERLTKTLGLLQDAIEEQGQQAIKLIEAASIDDGTGQNLDIRI